MAITIKKPKKSKINYKIDSTLIDNLYRTRIKLKKSARFGSDVAGVCLLGEKNGLIDEFVPIIARGGCWDSPSISHAVFDKAFLINKNQDEMQHRLLHIQCLLIFLFYLLNRVYLSRF